MSPMRRAMLQHGPVPASTVDWSRFHLSVVFVDSDDMGAARIAQAFFESITEWNGYGRAMYANTCGTDTTASYKPETALSLMQRAANLGASPKIFAREPEQLTTQDLYIYDVIVAMDQAAEASMLDLFNADLMSSWDHDEDRTYYRGRVCTLARFFNYAGDATLKERGGQGLVPPQLSKLYTGRLGRLKALNDVPIAPLRDVEAWNLMVISILLGTASLSKYLMDSYPEDLDQFWLR